MNQSYGRSAFWRASMNEVDASLARGVFTFLLVEFARLIAIDLTTSLMFKSETLHCKEQLTERIEITSRGYPSSRTSFTREQEMCRRKSDESTKTRFQVLKRKLAKI